MTGFFIILLGFLYYIIHGAGAIIKRDKEKEKYYTQVRQRAKERNRVVYLESYKCTLLPNGQKSYIPIYRETDTNREVVLLNSKVGLKRWYYIDDKKPLVYKVNETLHNNVMKSFNEKKEKGGLWFVALNFWDDTIYRLEKNKFLFHTYLDDYRAAFDPIEAEEWRKFNSFSKTNQTFIGVYTNKIEYIRSCFVNDTVKNKIKAKRYFKNNNPLNQKIYRNMHPYQLHLIYHITEEAKRQNNWNLVEHQYVIRFMKRQPTYYEQRCISDKEWDTIWTKWYAITEEQFNLLTDTDCPYCKTIEFNSIDNCKVYIKELNPNTVAYLNKEQSIYDIAVAFDDDMNFIGEELF